MHSIEELRVKVEALREEIKALADADELTPEQDERLDAALVEFDEARESFEKAEARAAKVADAARFAAHPENIRPATEGFTVNTRTADPFDLSELRALTPDQRASEIRARAIDIVEKDRTNHLTDEQREDLTQRLSRRNNVARDIAELVAQTGSEEYQRAFETVLANPGSYSAMNEMRARADEISARTSLQQAGTIGALYVPYQLDSTVILTNAGTINPVRAISRNVQITGAQSWNANTSAGVTAAVLGETVAASDNTPTFTSTNIPVWKQAAWAFGAFETLADSGDVAGELSVMFADAKNRLESQLFTTGTGSSQPQGVVVFASNATSVVTGSSTGGANSADLAAADIYALRNQLSPRWRGNASWVANLAVAHSIRQLGTSSNYHAFSLDLTQSTSELQLLGRPFYECSDMDSTIVSGSTDFVLLHGDFSQFVVVDRVGMQIMYEDMLYSGGKVPTGEAGWFVFWRSGSGGLVQDAFRLLKL